VGAVAVAGAGDMEVAAAIARKNNGNSNGQSSYRMSMKANIPKLLTIAAIQVAVMVFFYRLHALDKNNASFWSSELAIFVIPMGCGFVGYFTIIARALRTRMPQVIGALTAGAIALIIDLLNYALFGFIAYNLYGT